MSALFTRRSLLSSSVFLAASGLIAACGGSPASPAAEKKADTSAKPAEAAKPTEAAKPAESKPAEAKPAEAKPVATAAAATKPDAKPAETKPSPAGGTPVRGGTFTYGNGKPSKNVINPLNTVGTGQNVLIEALFLRLVHGRVWGDGMNPAESGPIDLAVAKTMKEVEKDRVWEFELRDNVKWHDGKPVTADDVIFGIWLGLNKNAKATNETPMPNLKGAAKLQKDGSDTVAVEGATKVNDMTVRIELDRPVPNYWVNWSVGYWPMPKHIFGAMPLDKIFDEPYATKPIGNGPFKAVRYVDGQYMEMEANPDFYLGRPNLDKFIVRFGDADTLTAAMEAQEIDGMNVAAGPVYDRLTSLPHIVGNPVPRNHPDGFVVNAERHPQAPALHKAIMYGLDVNTLNKQLYSGTLRLSNYLFEHIVGLEQPPAGMTKYSYDPDKAKSILKEASWDSNKELEWMMWSKPGPQQDALQAMLGQIGIKTKYRIIDAATVIDELYRKANYDISFGNFSADQDLESVWKYIKSGWGYDQGGFNYARFNDKEIDSVWEKGIAERDDKKRKELFDQVTLMLDKKPPQATLWRISINYVWNKRVKGAWPYQYRRPARPALEKVWIQK